MWGDTAKQWCSQDQSPEPSSPGKKWQGNCFLLLLKEFPPPIPSSLVSDQELKFKPHRDYKRGIIFSESTGKFTSDDLRFPAHTMLCQEIPFPDLVLCFCLLC